ncbi:hypothetical protein ACHAPV_003083 [Trichoderma viride]
MAYNRGVSLTQVHPSPGAGAGADTDIDIIAIHGLDTKSPDTWISRSNFPHEDVNWLACPHMLPERIGPARIFTCDWPANLLERPDLVQKTADEFARLLLAGIKRRPLPTKTGYAKTKDRPIVFIASCLGGIILIKALVIAGHSSEYAVVRQSTRGIIFLATPFRGTSFQDVADWAEPGLRAWASIRGQKVSSLLDDVKGSTFHLEELVRKFTQLCHDKDSPFQVVTFYELGLTSLHRKFPLSWLIPSGVLDLVVPSKPLVDSSSATLDIVTDPLPLNRRHVMMNKFNGPGDPDYQCVIGKIEEILQEIRTNSPLDEADAWIRNKHYAVDKLKIERLSGQDLSMDQCYINLAVVEQRGQDSDQPMTENAKSSRFSIFNRQKIETPDTTVQAELATIFNQRQNRNGEMIQPRRILIRGRAGVGKTTLCKKIVHEFTQGTWSGWNDLFDRILWVPLRNLKLEERRQHPAYDFEALLTHEYFSLPNNKPDFARHLAQALESSSSRTLFLLDGLDEVSQELAGSNSMSRFLNELLEQPNIIVTSRPSGRLPLNLDLELEAVGFYPDQVKSYIEKTFSNPNTTKIDEKKVNKIQSFLQNHWLVQGLVRIPIQLDALCYSWDDIRSDMPETMTALYQAIELCLWKKDIVRLEKKHDDKLVTPHHIRDASQQKIEEFVKNEISFLESLAFAGLYSEIIEFEPKHLNFISDRFPGFLPDKDALPLSFLRTSNPSSEFRSRSYHFIHLTFQEYFAARYFVRQWTAREPLRYVELGSRTTNKIEPAKFFQKHKYTARYDILWRFVAGLLDVEPEEISLFFQNIEDEPLDLLGPAHQRLVMHCLSEVTSNILIRTDLEQRLSKWLLFECEIMKNASSLASEVEFPEQALDTALREGSDKVKLKILRSIPQRAITPANIIKQAITWLGHKDINIREAAIRVLRQSTLPTETLVIVAEKLEDKDEVVREATRMVLCGRSTLPKELLEAIAARLDDEDIAVQEVTIEALGQRLALPDEILKAVAAKLEDEHKDVRIATVQTLRQQSTLPDEILKAVAVRLEDKEQIVQQAAIGALGQQPALPDEILKAVAARLKDEHKDVRIATVYALGKQSILPDEILKAVAAKLEDEHKDVRKATVYALSKQSILPDEILKAVAARLEDEHEEVRIATVYALSKQSILPDEILKAVAAKLKDEHEDVRIATVYALGKQSILPDEILKALTARLEDEHKDVQGVALEVLGRQLVLPDASLQAIVALLENENRYIAQTAWEVLNQPKRLSPPSKRIKEMIMQIRTKGWSILYDPFRALQQHISLSDEDLKAIAALLEDNETSLIQAVAIEALGNQANLPNEMLLAILSKFEDNSFGIQTAAIRALGRQSKSSLPNEILNGIAARLNDKTISLFTRKTAVGVFGNQSDLSNEILNVIAAELEGKDAFVKRAAIRALDNQCYFGGASEKV